MAGDERIRARGTRRQTVERAGSECWQLLGSVSLGRIATGMARLVRDSAVIARCEQMLQPWAVGQMDYVIAIKPQMITGIRLAGWSPLTVSRTAVRS